MPSGRGQGCPRGYPSARMASVAIRSAGWRPARGINPGIAPGGGPMALGYDGMLYILAFDHRGSFQKKMFGIQGDPTPEQTDAIADAKHLIFEGLLKASEQGAEPSVTGCLVDEQFGAPRGIPEQAKERGLILSMPVEKSGQDEFDFDYGEDFGAHIEKFDPEFSKVLVRYNPEGDEGMNTRQVERLRRLA